MSDYEDGDVNVVDEAGADLVDEDLDTGGDLAEVPVKVTTFLARSLADEPDEVVVESSTRGAQVKLSLTVAPGDMGRVIGRRGRTAQALRTVVAAAGAKVGAQTNVDIVDV